MGFVEPDDKNQIYDIQKRVYKPCRSQCSSVRVCSSGRYLRILPSKFSFEEFCDTTVKMAARYFLKESILIVLLSSISFTIGCESGSETVLTTSDLMQKYGQGMRRSASSSLI